MLNQTDKMEITTLELWRIFRELGASKTTEVIEKGSFPAKASSIFGLLIAANYSNIELLSCFFKYFVLDTARSIFFRKSIKTRWVSNIKTSHIKMKDVKKEMIPSVRLICNLSFCYITIWLVYYHQFLWCKCQVKVGLLQVWFIFLKWRVHSLNYFFDEPSPLIFKQVEQV